MSDRAIEFLRELRDNWDDHYWWLRHPALQAAVLAIVAGVIGLLFTILETRVKTRATAGGVS
jgi:hypothetical protein